MCVEIKGKTPCANCPYRKDAPLQHWHKIEFEKVLKSESDYFGTTFACHKQNGTVCKGWLIDQDKRNHPSLALRIALIKQGVTRKYLDALNSKHELYTPMEMIEANYPELLKK